MERREPSLTKEEKDRCASPPAPRCPAVRPPLLPRSDLRSTFILSSLTCPRDLPFSRPQLRVSPATPKARAGEEGARPAKESVRVKEERKEEAAAAAAAAAAGPQGLHLLFERPRPPPFLGPSPPERCAGFLEPAWLAGPPRLSRPPRFYEAGEELTGPGAVAAARLYGLEPAHPLLYSRLAPPPPPTAAPGTPHLLSKTPPGALLGAPPPLVPAPRPSSPPRAPGPARADR